MEITIEATVKRKSHREKKRNAKQRCDEWNNRRKKRGPEKGGAAEDAILSRCVRDSVVVVWREIGGVHGGHVVVAMVILLVGKVSDEAVGVVHHHCVLGLRLVGGREVVELALGPNTDTCCTQHHGYTTVAKQRWRTGADFLDQCLPCLHRLDFCNCVLFSTLTLSWVISVKDEFWLSTCLSFFLGILNNGIKGSKL